MFTTVRLFHAKKMHSASGVPAAAMSWLVFTLLLSSVAAGVETTKTVKEVITISSTHTHVTQAAAVETTTKTVKVITTPVFGHIPRHKASKDFQVLVRVEAPLAAQQQRRVPVDLAVVFDVGGGGATGTATARMDAVKNAIKFVIRQILHDDDRLAIVGLLGDEATGFLNLNTSDARRKAVRSVDKLEARGEFTSSAGAGLEEAIMILREEQPVSSRAPFVILVTEAATTEDSGRFSELLALEDLPPVHTLGVGAAYDPRALLDIASESQGTFSFVDDKNTDGITGAVAVCLSGLKDVVAVGARVVVETPVGSAVTIERIDSGGYSSSTGDDKKSVEIDVGVLYAGEVKNFLVHLSVPAALPSSTTPMSSVVDGGCDKQQLLTATFVGLYTTTDEDEYPSPQAVLYVQRPPPEDFDAAGGGALQRVPVPLVMNHIARFAALEMVNTFVDTVGSITVEVAANLRFEWEKFVQERQFWSGLDLGALDGEVSKMVTFLEAAAAGSGSSATTAYMLSWLSSYQMQRPTAMGSPSVVAAAFVTVNMQIALQQATTNGALCIGDDDGCPACEKCVDRCVEAVPPPVFEPSGRDGDTYRVNEAYLPVVGPGLLMDAINEAMKQMYLSLIQANKLKTCGDDAIAGVRVHPSPLPPLY